MRRRFISIPLQGPFLFATAVSEGLDVCQLARHAVTEWDQTDSVAKDWIVHVTGARTTEEADKKSEKTFKHRREKLER